MYPSRAQETQASRVCNLSLLCAYVDQHYYSTHEQLQEKAHEKDIQIQNLLRQFDQLRAEQKIHHWVEKVHVNEMGNEPGMLNVYFRPLFMLNLGQAGRNKPGTQALKWDYKGKSPESAAISFFKGRLDVATDVFSSDCILAPRTHVTPPLIIKHCTLYPEEIQELFSLYGFFLPSLSSLIESVLILGILRE